MADAHDATSAPDGLTRDQWLQLVRERRNPGYGPLPGPDVPMWRYLSFEALLELLTSEQLFCPSVPTLLSADPYEGSLTERDLAQRAARTAYLEARTAGLVSGAPPAPGARTWADIERVELEYIRFQVRWTFVSSWHANLRESMAMWRVYAANGKGFAIKTTVGKIDGWLDTLRSPPMGEPILAPVRYLDRTTDAADIQLHLSEVLWKDQAYEDEREVRFVFRDAPMDPLPGNDGTTPRWLEPPQVGRHLPFPVAQLLDEIVVGPQTEPWVVDLLTRLVGRLGPAIPVRPSSLRVASSSNP